MNPTPEQVVQAEAEERAAAEIGKSMETQDD